MTDDRDTTPGRTSGMSRWQLVDYFLGLLVAGQAPLSILGGFIGGRDLLVSWMTFNTVCLVLIAASYLVFPRFSPMTFLVPMVTSVLMAAMLAGGGYRNTDVLRLAAIHVGAVAAMWLRSKVSFGKRPTERKAA